MGSDYYMQSQSEAPARLAEALREVKELRDTLDTMRERAKLALAELEEVGSKPWMHVYRAREILKEGLK